MSDTTSQNILSFIEGGTTSLPPKSTSPLFPNGTGRVLFTEAIGGEIFNPKSNFCFQGGQFSSPLGTVASPVEVKVPRVKRVGGQSKERYILLKKYQGYVSSRNETAFVARLFEDATEYPVMEAEFDLEELSETDRQLAVEGAALVWTIGYHENGPRKRESLIYLRRQPGWTAKEAQQAEAEAAALTSDIDWK
jgi:hypothetical protein